MAADEVSSTERIRSMTLAISARFFSHALSRFDELPSDQKPAIRDLDARLVKLDPEVRDRYMVILRRYHTIYNSLPKDRRKLLDNETNPVEKLKLLVQFKKDYERGECPGGPEAGRCPARLGSHAE